MASTGAVQTPDGTDRRPDRADIVAMAAAAVSIVVLVLLGRGLTFFADEWAVIGDRPLGLDTFLRPFNEHWLGVTTFVHRAMVETIGIDSYVPYLFVLAVLHAIVVVLVYLLARRSTWPALAAAIAVVVALFGSGFENLFWAMQMGFVGAIALGLTAMLLVDGGATTSRVAIATGLLTVGVMTSGFGLFMLALVGFDLLLHPGRRRFVVALVIPAAVYAAWYLTLGRGGLSTYGDPFTVPTLLALPGFVLGGTAEGFGSALGVGRLGGAIAAGVFVVVLVARLVRREPVSPRALACLGTIVVMYALLGIVRAQLDVDATYYSRYSYLSGILALIGIAALIGHATLPDEPRRRRLVVVVVGLVVFLSIAWNVRLLVAGRALFAERAELTRAMVELGLSTPLPDGVRPDLSLVLVPSPVRLHAIVDRFGSPLDDELASGAIPPIGEAARREALERATNPPDWLLAQPDLP